MKSLEAHEYQVNYLTDITDEDLYLILHPKENPSEAHKSRNLFQELTEVTFSKDTYEKVLKELIKEKKFDHFSVNMGFKKEQVWRSLHKEMPVEVVLEPVPIVEDQTINLMEYWNLVIEKTDMATYFKTPVHFLDKVFWHATQQPTGFNKGTRRISHTINLKNMESYIVEVVNSTRALPSKPDMVESLTEVLKEIS